MTPVEITRTFPAPPERLWHALTDPAALAAWFWPHLDNTVDVDLRVGGRYRITGPRAGIAVDGEYLAVDPPKRLVFTWQWDARGRAQPGSGGAAPGRRGHRTDSGARPDRRQHHPRPVRRRLARLPRPPARPAPHLTHRLDLVGCRAILCGEMSGITGCKIAPYSTKSGSPPAAAPVIGVLRAERSGPVTVAGEDHLCPVGQRVGPVVRVGPGPAEDGESELGEAFLPQLLPP